MKTTESRAAADRTSSKAATPAPPPYPRAPYAAPALERLGEWSALTLQQSIPIFP